MKIPGVPSSVGEMVDQEQRRRATKHVWWLPAAVSVAAFGIMVWRDELSGLADWIDTERVSLLAGLLVGWVAIKRPGDIGK